MIGFNAFQLVCLFAAAPFIIGWLMQGPFSYATPLGFAACAAYVVGFFGMTASVADSLS